MSKLINFTFYEQSNCIWYTIGFAQSKAYQKDKAEKIKEGSVFTKTINIELPVTIVYEDDDIIAFVPLRLQAKVHLLIVLKKRFIPLTILQMKTHYC